MENDPDHRIEIVLAFRELVRAKRIYDNPNIKQADRPDSPMMEMIEAFDFEDAAPGRPRASQGESEETLVGAPVGPSPELLAKARAFREGKE